jgi:hypothetical protein
LRRSIVGLFAHRKNLFGCCCQRGRSTLT